MRIPNWPSSAESQVAEVLGQLQNVAEVEGQWVFVRVVAVPAQDTTSLRAVFARIDICRDGDLKLGPRFRYKSVVTLAERLSGLEFVGRFRAAVETGVPLVCDGAEVLFPSTSSNWRGNSHFTDNEYATWPCSQFECPIFTQELPVGPFASAKGYPYFGELAELIESVAEFGVFHGPSDARVNSVQIIRWHYDGRIADVEFGHPSSGVIHVEGDGLGELTLVGRAIGTDDVEQISVVAQSRTSISFTGDAQQLDLALLDGNDRIVDHRVLEASQLPRSVSKRAQVAEAVFLKCIELGECANVEFKPFVRLEGNDGKWQEVLKTSIAMANARGGHIFIGINDQGVSSFGVEDIKTIGLAASIGAIQDPDNAERTQIMSKGVLEYGAQLRDRLQQFVNKSLAIHRRLLWLESKPVLVLSVPRGKEPPYLDKRDNSLWYRTNATNRRPSETELGRILGVEGA